MGPASGRVARHLAAWRTCGTFSGIAFQLGAFFNESQVEAINGEYRLYSRAADSGRAVNLHFCPTCGVSVYFRAEARPGLIGVHAGCFANPDFPAPTHAVWTESKHDWVQLPEVEHQFNQQSL